MSSDHCVLNRRIYFLGLCPRRDLGGHLERTMPCQVAMETRRWAQRGEISGAPLPQQPRPTRYQLWAAGHCVVSGNLCTLSPGQQVKLKQVIPLTEEEKTEHGVAAERRRMRLVYTDTIKDLLTHYVIQDGMCIRGQPGILRREAGVLTPTLNGGRKGSYYGPLSLVASGCTVLLGITIPSRESR